MKLKRFLSIFLCLLLVLGLSATALAESDQYVIDDYGGLTEDEASDLWNQADSVTTTYGVGVYVAMIDDYTDFGSTVSEAAEYIFDTLEFGVGDGHEGIFLLLSMAERDFDIDVHGTTANSVFTSYNRERIQDEFLDNFRNDDWYGGFSDFIRETEAYLSGEKGGGSSDDYDYGEDSYVDTSTISARLSWGPTWTVSIILGVILSLLISWIIRRATMHSVAKKVEAGAYVKGAAQFRIREDQFTHVTETRTKIERDNDSSGGGGGDHSHSSGKF